MKRFLIPLSLAIALAAALTAASAIAARDPWKAKFEGEGKRVSGSIAQGPLGTIEFGTKTVGHKHYLYSFRWTGVTMGCGTWPPPSSQHLETTSGVQTDYSAPALISLERRHKNFKFKIGPVLVQHGPDSEDFLYVTGKLTDHLKKAEGYLRVFRTRPVGDFPGHVEDCQTGFVIWKAKRKQSPTHHP